MNKFDKVWVRFSTHNESTGESSTETLKGYVHKSTSRGAYVALPDMMDKDAFRIENSEWFPYQCSRISIIPYGSKRRTN